MFRISISSKNLLLSGASILALLTANPAAATTLGGMTGRTPAAILATKPVTPSNGAAAGIPTSVSQAASQTAQSARDLTSAVAAIKAQMSAQDAAHTAAKSATSTVPNGITAGGLVPDSGLSSNGGANTVITWVNANTPTQTIASDGSATVTITQTDQKAIANWSSFNVGKNTTVHFDQSAGTDSSGANSWVILNRVNNATAPSQILGNMTAEGSVYLLNNNGVIFSGSAQVNTRSLVVSSLCLFSCTIGDANTAGTSTYRFLNGGIGDLNQNNYKTNEVLFTSNALGAGDITIQQGANIEATSGSLILMAAPNVTNSGRLVAPQGQVALIAGIGVSYDYNAVGFNQTASVNGSSVTQGYDDDLTTFLRFASYGRLIDSKGKDITPLGSVTNNGLIYTTEGNITLAGASLTQNGVLAATTSVKTAGAIILEAAYEIGSNGAQSPADTYTKNSVYKYYTGTVAIGSGSVTTILASDNGDTVPSDATSLSIFSSQAVGNGFGSTLPTSGYGLIEISGQAIDVKSGSLLYAPSQTIDIETDVMADARYPYLNTGRVLIESGATIDVSGLPDIQLSITDNLLTVSLGGNELANDPLQKNGALYGSKITVDLRKTGTDASTGESWVGTDVATLSDYLSLVTNTVPQLMTNGGTITLSAAEVIAEKGATLNVMGGYEHYLGALVQTTKLIDTSGRLVDIASADPLATYVGVAGQTTDISQRWGISTTYTNALLNQGTYEADYIQGGKGGTLNIVSGALTETTGTVATVPNAGALILGSTVLASAVSGDYQLANSTIPSAGTINIDVARPLVVTDPSFETNANYITALDVPNGFGMSSSLLAASGAVYTTNVVSSDSLNASGAANITITNMMSATNSTNDGTITVAKGASLTVQNGGAITLWGSNVSIDGTLTAHAGTISVTTTPVYRATNTIYGDITIGGDAVLDVSGVFANEYLDGTATANTQHINGGTIKLIANAVETYNVVTGIVSNNITGNITVDAGSLLDLSSGGLVLANGNLKTGSNGLPLGTGGNLTIGTYYSDGAGTFGTPITNPHAAAVARGRISLGGTIDALGFTSGGTLTIGAVAIQIGGDAAVLAKNEPVGYYFDPNYWGDTGFAGFNLYAVHTVTIPDNVAVTLTHQNLVLPGYDDYAMLKDVASGAKVSDYVSAGYLTGTALAPTNLSVVAGTENRSAGTGLDYFWLGQGASIMADPGAEIALKSWAMDVVYGSITAPGGSIDLEVNYNNGQGAAAGPLYIGANAVLDVSGTTLFNPIPAPVYTANGWVTPKTGKVLAGGSITLLDQMAPLVVAPGAVLNVSGASGVVQVVDDAAGSGVTGSKYTVTDTAEWSDAGSVTIKPGAQLMFEGTLVGKGGAADAMGGSLTLTALPNDSLLPSLILVQDTAAALASLGVTVDLTRYTPKTGGANQTVDSKIGFGLFGLDTLTGSGFANFETNTSNFAGQVSLNLPGSVIFNSSGLQAVLLGGNTGITDPNGAIRGGTNKASLSVNAGYIALGLQNPASSSYNLGAPATNDATVSLHGGTVDIQSGFTIGQVASTTIASDGDIRSVGSSSLLVGGDLTLIASTIYPATGAEFSIIDAGTLTIQYPTNGKAPTTTTPLSVGGILILDAATINQNGSLQAPLGQIFLGFDDSTVTATDLTGTTTTWTLSQGRITTSTSHDGTTSASTLSGGAITTSVNLGASSLTSVSANGNTLPLGTTIDTETWTYAGQTLTSAPQGTITLKGTSLTTAKGATVDLSGGGDIQASTWINGTGGTRDVLASSKLGTVYAIIPGYTGKPAAYDAANSQTVAAGKRIYLSGVAGLADGWYTLLPAAYATQPGAYRVVVTSTTDPVSTKLGTLADGTVVTKAYLGNAITDTKSSTGTLVEVQSGDVWKSYSEYALTSANSFFPAYATKNGYATPYTPVDAGRLVISAGTALDLAGTFNTAAGKDTSGNAGAGAQLDISGNLIEITATDSQTPTAGYIALSADMLDSLDFASILIGGTRTNTTNGTLLNITSNGVIVSNNADHPLAAPEILLVATPATTTTTVSVGGLAATLNIPVAGTGQVVLKDGSVVKASGAIGKGATNTLLLGVDPSTITTLSPIYSSGNSEPTVLQNYYTAVNKAAGSLVRISNGDAVTVVKADPSVFTPGSVTYTATGVTTALPSLANDTAVVVNGTAQLLGGKSLTLASTGNVTVDAGATLSGTKIDATSNQITFLGKGATSASGININQASLLNLQNSTTVNLQSSGNVVFEGDVNVAMSGDASSLTLGGNAFVSDGGAVTLSAGTVVLDDEKGSGTGTTASGKGSLAVNAGEIVFGQGNKTLSGFGSINLNATKGIVGSGQGIMDFGNLDVTLKTPIVIADASSTQTIKTAGALSVTSFGGTAMTSDALGGAITLQGGSVSVAVPVQALAGNITLYATNGDVTLAGTGSLTAKGVTKAFVDKTEYNYAGTVKLVSDTGTVTLASGSSVDVSGVGGKLAIQGKDVKLDGTLAATPISGYTGASFVLATGGSVALDALADKLTTAGFNNIIDITTGQGDLSLSKTLTGSSVILDAEVGLVTVTGTINASGTAGGTIELFGTKGVDVEGSLIATGSASDQLGGTVEIGTSGAFNTGTYNSTYGYENIAASDAGTITFGKNAKIDVSGGTFDGKTGGTVLIRTPLLQDGTVNVVFANGTSVAGARSVTLEPYATWSTTDATAGAKHFDGVIDPAGWYNAGGTLNAGQFTDFSGGVVASWNGTGFTTVALPGTTYTTINPIRTTTATYSWNAATQTLTLTTTITPGGGTTVVQYSGTAAVEAYLLENEYFAPTTYNTDHESFYGYGNGTVGGQAGTAMGFIQTLAVPVTGASSIANFQVAPGVELKNPSAAINGGDIKVLSNWNLGAKNANGASLFRTASGIAPIATLRAVGNLAVDASISDGFIQVGNTISTANLVTSIYSNYSTVLSAYNSVASTYSGTTIGKLSYLTNSLLAANGETTGQMALAAPASTNALGLSSTSSYDQYYVVWQSYKTSYSSSYYPNLTSSSYTSYYSAAGLTLATTNAATLAGASSKSNVQSAISYAVATQADLNTLQADIAKFQSATTGLAALPAYKTYLNDYATYASDYSNWASTTAGSLHYKIASLIQPLLAPPTTSVALEAPVTTALSYAAVNSPNVVATASNQAAIGGMALSNEAQSSSYRLVAGADMGNADPLAVDAASSSNVTIDGHTLIRLANSSTYVIGQPTTVRTGTGSIDIAASGNFALLDSLLPGTVYTAGKAAAAPTAANAATIALSPGYYYDATYNGGIFLYSSGVGESYLITSATNASGSGNISINVLGDINGIEYVTDTLASGPSPLASGLSSKAGNYIGQMWTAWLLTNPSDATIPWYVNYGSFDQGILSVGGNVTITAGNTVRDLGVSAATTGRNNSDGTTTYTGGGNVSVTAGGGIYSGSYYLGSGTGTIRSGGTIASDITSLSDTTAYQVSTVLALQNATINVAARGSVDIGGAYDPTYLWTSNILGSLQSPVANYTSNLKTTSTNYVPYFTSLTAASGVSAQSASGDVSFNTLEVEAGLIVNGIGTATTAATTSLLLPSSLQLVSFNGDVNVEHGGGLFPSATGTLQLLAEDNVDLYVSSVVTNGNLAAMDFPRAGNVFGYTLTLLDYPVGTGLLPTAQKKTLTSAYLLSETQLHDPKLLEERTGSAEPVRVYALTGDISSGTALPAGNSYSFTFYDGTSFPGTRLGQNEATGEKVFQLSLITNTPTAIYAGGDVRDLPFFGENYQSSDITSVIAGGSITYSKQGDEQTPVIEVAGPGSLYVQAGGNIEFPSQRLSGVTESGIITTGNAIDKNAYPILYPVGPYFGSAYLPTSVLAYYGNPYLPLGGADVDVIYGAKFGMDTTSFINTYVKAAASDTTATAYLDDLNAFLKKQKKGNGDLSAAEAWSAFESLPDLAKKLFVTEIYFDILNQTGLDYNNPNSTYYHQYARGYGAINMLFPSSWGYTANSLEGGANGANTLVNTGILDIRGSRIQTGQGGNISILGPGGRVLVGSASASVATNPASEGIITFERGNIDIFSDESIQVAQSRIMTEQGGNLVIWSSNGDINAGKGAKTAVSNPPPVYACDLTHYCMVDARGIVTGAGIASLQTIESAPTGDANMIAPRGTVDAGAAGIRVSGNLNIAALYVANVFNIEVKGTTVGVPVLVTNLDLATASNASTDAASILNSMKSQEPQNTIDVEVVGFGGDFSHPGECVAGKDGDCGQRKH